MAYDLSRDQGFALAISNFGHLAICCLKDDSFGERNRSSGRYFPIKIFSYNLTNTVSSTDKLCSACGINYWSTSSDKAHINQDWSNSINYDFLIRNQEVEDMLIRRYPELASTTGDHDFFAQILVKPITNFASSVLSVYAHTGIQTGKTRSEQMKKPCGKVLLAVLIHLARSHLKIKSIQQGSDTCLLKCTIPFDMWSFQGELLVKITKGDLVTQLDAKTKIPGQKYDWGKSNRILNNLFKAVCRDI